MPSGLALVGAGIGALIFGALAQKGRKKFYGMGRHAGGDHGKTPKTARHLGRLAGDKTNASAVVRQIAGTAPRSLEDINTDADGDLLQPAGAGTDPDSWLQIDGTLVAVSPILCPAVAPTPPLAGSVRGRQHGARWQMIDDALPAHGRTAIQPRPTGGTGSGNERQDAGPPST